MPQVSATSRRRLTRLSACAVLLLGAAVTRTAPAAAEGLAESSKPRSTRFT